MPYSDKEKQREYNKQRMRKVREKKYNQGLITDYNNGKIYKITSLMGDDIYIGSTTEVRLCDRLANHRISYHQWKNGKPKYTTSFDIFEKYGIENCIIELIELVCYESKKELLAREAYWIRKTTCVNKNIPLRTNKEYCIDNKEKVSESQKQYKIKNKETIDEYRKAKIICDCGCSVRRDVLARHKESKKHHKYNEGLPNDIIVTNPQ